MRLNGNPAVNELIKSNFGTYSSSICRRLLVNLVEKSGIKKKEYFEKFLSETFELIADRNAFIMTDSQCSQVTKLLRELSRRDDDEFVILLKLANAKCKRGQRSLIQECNENFQYKIDWNNIIVCHSCKTKCCPSCSFCFLFLCFGFLCVVDFKSTQRVMSSVFWCYLI